MFAVIDIETTGGSAEREKITEIAIILHDGHKEEGRFSTLINPERRIPAYITEITGINDDMVEHAPKFYEVAKQVVELTEGRIFVAHNVNFDYSFIREEFRRLGYPFQRSLLCTVRTSRILIPGHASYSLGRFCAALGIPIRDRHRALGDAEATAILLERLVQIQPTLAQTKSPKDPFAKVPERIPRERLLKLPEDPGAFWLFDAQGMVLQSQSTGNIRGAFLKAFNKAKHSLGLAVDVEWALAGNEWMAGLLLIARNGENETPGKSADKFDVVLYSDQKDYLRVGIVPKTSNPGRIASFNTLEDAKAALEARVKRFNLCPVLCGLESSKNGHCSHFPGGGCQGACCGKEDAGTYNQRVGAGLKGLGFPHGRFAIVDRGRGMDEIAVALVEDGTCVSFGNLDLSLEWNSWEEISAALDAYPFPVLGGQWIRKNLGKLPQASIKPL